MVQVFIQPSYGTPGARRHWADTLTRAVPFHDLGLSREDLTGLTAAHPSGRTRLWGTTDKHDKRMDTLAPGDVALLTGRKHVLAIGEVGYSFRDPDFARRLWRPEPGKCLWSNVYSFRGYWPVHVPYEEIWALPGFSAGDNFMGLRFLAPEKADVVLAHIAEDRRSAPAAEDEICPAVV
ncbi:hypothetical protein [Lentzea sp.]|uniref:hypothetical protein n=1 Tax=Lentzea sp. TaxID=56099 RepID=UPI002ED5D066